MTPVSLLGPFLLTVAVSFLIGAGLREYYNAERKFETFGSVRTCILIGMLGFVLFLVPSPGAALYVAGQLSLAAILSIYYVDKLREKKGAGIIGILIGMLTFAIGPLALLEPPWVVVLLGISVLFAIHSKGRIRRFTDRLSPDEVLTACQFLAIAAVVLPIVPATVPELHGWLGRWLAWLPVTPRQLWIAVVITTSISYAGYLAHMYLFPTRGLLLTGLLGGIYSSTATVLVIAKRSVEMLDVAGSDAAAAVLFAVTMMYVRLAALIAIFRPPLLAQSALPLAVLALAAGACGVWLRPRSAEVQPDARAANGTIRHPLEAMAAVVFAVAFAVVAGLTKLTLVMFPEHGLRWLAFAVGFSDITPFVVSVLQGNLGLTSRDVVDGVLIASASNNVLKSVYIWSAGSRGLAKTVTPILLSFAAVTFVYCVWR